MQLTRKLFTYLHRIFSRDPEAFLALRLQYDGGMTWEIRDGYLHTTVSGGTGSNLSVNLGPYTIAGLAAHLASQAGYTVEYSDTTSMSLLSARVLIDGTNDIAMSNGDHLYGYTSTLWAYLEPIAAELTTARQQIGEMLKQMNTGSGSNEWLDEHGSYYSVPRRTGEPDSSYGPRIIAEVLRPRGNNIAIAQAIREYSGQDVTVNDVVLYGDTSPLYNDTITHNGSYNHNAALEPLYGLFDVVVGYDLLGGDDIEQFQELIIDLVNRLRDAGTHMRSLLLSGSTIEETATAPTDGPAVMAVLAGVDISETLTAPTEISNAMAGFLAEMTESLAAPSDSSDLNIEYDYQYNAIRSYNGKILHLGGMAVSETI